MQESDSSNLLENSSIHLPFQMASDIKPHQMKKKKGKQPSGAAERSRSRAVVTPIDKDF